MASIQKRGNAYQIKASCGYDTRGKQVVQTMTWKPSAGMSEAQIKKELNKVAVLFEQECGRGKMTSAVKFQTFAERWFEEYARLSLKTRTIQSYEQLTKRIYEKIGHLRLDKITARDIQKLILEMNDPQTGTRHDKYKKGKLSAKTIKNHVMLISSIFEYAIKNQLVQFNPCRAVTLPRPNKKERDIYTVEEALRLLTLLDKEPEKNFKFVVFFNLAMYTGLRRGELLAVEYKDFDFEHNILNVVRSSAWQNDKGMFTDSPKTESSKRCLKLPPHILDLLNRYRKQQTEYKASIGDKWVTQISGMNGVMVENDRLFTRWNGEPMFPNTPDLYFGRFCKRTGMRYVNIHSWRHFAASCMVFAGTDVKTVQGILGHSSPQTTMSLYLHSFQEAQVRAMDVIATALDRTSEKEREQEQPTKRPCKTLKFPGEMQA